MKFPESHPDLGEILEKQGRDKRSITGIMAIIMGISIEKSIPAPESIDLIANGLLSYVHKVRAWNNTEEGKAFMGWAKENPDEAIKAIEKDINTKELMKNRMN